MTIDRAINILIPLTLVEMMIAIGLEVPGPDLLAVARNRPLLARAVVANFLLVPAITLGLLMLVDPPPLVAIGFLLAAICPGAPYGPPCTGMARGSVSTAVGLMVVLAGASAVVAPLLLVTLQPWLAPGEALRLNVPGLLATLAGVQLLPLAIGLAVRWRRPALAASLAGPARRISAALNVLLIVMVLAAHGQTLLAIRPRGYAAMLTLVLASLAAGWLLGTNGFAQRRALALTTALRNVGVSLVLANGCFPGTPAVTAALALGLFQTIVVVGLALAWGRWALSRAGPALT